MVMPFKACLFELILQYAALVRFPATDFPFTGGKLLEEFERLMICNNDFDPESQQYQGYSTFWQYVTPKVVGWSFASILDLVEVRSVVGRLLPSMDCSPRNIIVLLSVASVILCWCVLLVTQGSQFKPGCGRWFFSGRKSFKQSSPGWCLSCRSRV